MIESVIEWSIRNRYLVILGYVLLGIAGVRALGEMPVDAIPDVSENQVIVFTDWMGASPQEIEDQVSYPLSVNLQGLAGVRVVRSSSEFNFSMISIIFNDDTDIYFARSACLKNSRSPRHSCHKVSRPISRPIPRRSARFSGTRSRARAKT